MGTTSSTSRTSIWQRLRNVLRNDACEADDAKCFRDDQEKEKAFAARERGLQTVPLDRIVGSVGRYRDFDSRFRSKHREPSERVERIRAAMREGKPLPPVKLYQIKDEYYVLDGNHRIAVAKSLGHDEILATIVEFIPSLDTLENLRYRERSAFRDRTGLSSPIDLTEIGQYDLLLNQISEHQEHLRKTAGEPISFESAAEDWYRTIYTPLCGIVRKGRLSDSFPERTTADLYAYISHHQWEEGRKRSYGIGVDKMIPKDMEAFREKMANMEKKEYPDMKQGVVAFILMNVQARKEERIIERLYELDGVREIHSVFGDVDLVVKIVLTRDLLSSDSEIISQFVQGKIRQLSGVVSTNTLIPGLSKVK